MYKKIQKFLDWGVKIASLAITAPATWIVATELFADVQIPALLFAMRFAAVFLIEGVLLSNWLLLEFDVKASPEIKTRYAITALSMYASLAIIGWKHEGPTGIVFRVALLAALLGSGWDTYVYTWQRATSRVDREATNSGKVKRHARRLSVREAILRREAQHEAELTLIQAEGSASQVSNELYGKRLLANIDLEHQGEYLDLEDQRERLFARRRPKGNGNGNNQRVAAATYDDSGEQQIPLPQADSNGHGTEKKNGSRQKSNLKPSKKAAKASPQANESAQRATIVDQNGKKLTEDQQLTHSILDAFAEDPNYTQRNLAEKLNVSRGKVSRLIKELLEDGLIFKDGRAYMVTDLAEPYLQGPANVRTRQQRR